MDQFNKDSRSFTSEQIEKLKIEKYDLQMLQNKNIPQHQRLNDVNDMLKGW